MTRTVLDQVTAPAPWRAKGGCGFCITVTTEGVRHDMCPGVIKGGAAGKDWTCACHAAGHGS